MNTLSYVDKELMANFFGIKGGFVFSFLKNGYNKTNTRDMILDATGIDIYNNPEYDMSQEKCIRKIWNDCDDYTVGRLLKVMLDYYIAVADWNWEWKEQQDYAALREKQEQLLKKQISLPTVEAQDISLLQQDIQHNFAANTPELVVDRLHTFAAKYLREICTLHGISIADDKGANYSLDGLAGRLKNFYRDSDYFSSEFCIVALQNSVNIFTKFNDIRNKQSFSHPNPIIDKAEAEYAVRIISDTLMFLDKIEHIQQRTDISGFDVDELPF